MKRFSTLSLVTILLLLLSYTTCFAKASTITFADREIQRIVKDVYGFDPNRIKQKQLESITKIEYSREKTGAYKTAHLTTLKDLEYFPNLEELVINNHENSLDLRGINKCKKLKRLVLRNCFINDIERIGDMPQLEELVIESAYHGCGIQDYSALKNLTNLKVLSLVNTANRYGSGDYDGSSISHLSNLRVLTLDTGIVNYSLASMSNLTELNITNYPLENILSDLEKSGACDTLKTLRCELRGLNQSEIRQIGILHNLEVLSLGFDFYGDAINLDGIEKLTNLRKLSVDTVYKFNSIKAIGKLPSIRELTITRAADLAGIRFLNNLSTLTTLRISVTGDIKLSELSSLKQLERIYIDGYVTSPYMLDLEGVEELKSLKEISYMGMKVKSFMPLDDLKGIKVIERNLGGTKTVVYE